MLRAAARTYVFVGGALILIAGAIGFVPFSVDGASCGPAFIATSDPFEADLQDTWSDASDIAAAAEAGSHQEACSLRRNELRLAALTLVGVGAVALVTPRLGPLLRSMREVALER
jgi:hypothetical protein